jgi:hypothetical protein
MAPVGRRLRAAVPCSRHGCRRSTSRPVPDRLRVPVLTGRRIPTSVIGGYIALTKPRIIELLLITTVPTMVLAEQGWPAWRLLAITLLGGTLAAGGANAINMVVDRDIDALMERTQGRPLVTGLVQPRGALIFAVALEIAAFAVLWAGANLLSAVLALSAALFYVFVYTLWLKRTSTQNIVIGGAAGAVPVLVGWAAVLDSLDWAPIVLFGVIFFWTPPTLLGARHPACRRLPGRRCADAAVGGSHRAGRALDGRLHRGAGRLLAAPGARGRHGLDLRGLGRRARWPVPLGHRRPGPRPFREDGRCGSSATPSATSRCCSERSPSTCWCATVCESGP